MLKHSQVRFECDVCQAQAVGSEGPFVENVEELSLPVGWAAVWRVERNMRDLGHLCSDDCLAKLAVSYLGHQIDDPGRQLSLERAVVKR